MKSRWSSGNMVELKHPVDIRHPSRGGNKVELKLSEARHVEGKHGRIKTNRRRLWVRTRRSKGGTW